MGTATDLPHWTLGERMSKARESAGMTRRQMADELRVSERTIRNYEGEHTRVTRDTVMAYAAITGVPVWWIEADGGSATPAPRSRCSPLIHEQLSLSVAA